MILAETTMMTNQRDFHPFPLDPAEGTPASFNGRIEQSKLRRLTKEVQDIAGLYNVAVAAGSSLKLEEIIWAIYKESGRIIDTGNFAIAICDPQSDHLNFALVFDRGRKAEAISIPGADQQSLTTHVLDTQIPLLINMHLDYCQQLLKREPDHLAEELKLAKALARQAVDEIRTFLFELRPLVLETEGLVPALRVFLKRRQQEVAGTTRLRLKIHPPDQHGAISDLGEKVEMTLFAIVQEAVNNALKHARAANIVIELNETAAEIYVKITDDGVGFDLATARVKSARRGSLGMVNLRERAELIGGELQLHSEPGLGTEVLVHVPKAEDE